MMKFLICVLLVGVLYGLVGCYPLHASCKLNWTFNTDCSSVHDKLISQMKVWNTSYPCGSNNDSEKCHYQILSESATKISATHTTPVKQYVDDLTFTLTNTSTGCSVEGYSTSEVWYAVLDYGTNYCNLRNLADGSGLSTSSGFKEVTSDSVCTQFSSHNCTKY